MVILNVEMLICLRLDTLVGKLIGPIVLEMKLNNLLNLILFIL